MKTECNGCGKPLEVANAWMEDGCPCNTRAGVNDDNLGRWRLLHQLQQQQSRENADLRRRIGELEAALRPFAAMDRPGCTLSEVACIRGVASDMTMITSHDWRNAALALKDSTNA